MNTELPSSAGRSHARLDVMNYLNEIAGRHPAAISLASGRPAEKFFDFEQWVRGVPQFVAHQARELGIPASSAFDLLAQYGRTNGIINELVARQIGADDGIDCSPEQILMANGAQEALSLVVTTLCQHPDDVLLVRSPCYIGITGIADLNGIELVHFGAHDGEEDRGLARLLENAIDGARLRGKRPRALYLVPTFDNPTGSVLDASTRQDILSVCAANDIVVLEDNPYGAFRFEGAPVPAMHALDRSGCVVYIGTYSKTLCPAVRVGFAVLPRRLFGDAAASRALMARLSQAKSFVSVNTSQLTQAVVGALLLSEQCSLRRLAQAPTAHYRGNRDAMLACLAREFADLREGVSWNLPQGGFFLCVTLPFAFGRREADICASRFGVLVMPLSFFALDDAHDHQVRLAFSNVARDRIEEGVGRFGAFVRNRLAQGAGDTPARSALQ
jgi:(S)-3,5-dihydroxyphenylglycine transaminase